MVNWITKLLVVLDYTLDLEPITTLTLLAIRNVESFDRSKTTNIDNLVSEIASFVDTVPTSIVISTAFELSDYKI